MDGFRSSKFVIVPRRFAIVNEQAAIWPPSLPFLRADSMRERQSPYQGYEI